MTNESNFYRCSYLPFMFKKNFYTVVPSTSLTAIVSIGDTEVNFDTTNFLSSGAVLMEGDVVKYTGKSATQLTGVTGVSTGHAVDVTVHQLYELPSDISEDFSLRLPRNDNNHPDITRVDGRFESSNKEYYQVITDSDGNQYIFVSGLNSDEDKLLLQYIPSTTDMVNNSDVCIIPDPYCLRIIPDLAAGELFLEKEEVDLAQIRLRTKAYPKLKEMYKKYNRQTKARTRIIGPNRPKTIYSDKLYGSRTQGRYGSY